MRTSATCTSQFDRITYNVSLHTGTPGPRMRRKAGAFIIQIETVMNPVKVLVLLCIRSVLYQTTVAAAFASLKGLLCVRDSLKQMSMTRCRQKLLK